MTSTSDADFGPIAPIAELTAPIDVEEARRIRFAEMLDDLIHPKDTASDDSCLTTSQTE